MSTDNTQIMFFSLLLLTVLAFINALINTYFVSQHLILAVH